MPADDPLEALKPVWDETPLLNLPILVPKAAKEARTNILPERGTGRKTGRARDERRGNPRNDIERLLRHWGLIE